MGSARRAIVGAALGLLALGACGSPEDNPTPTVTASATTCRPGAACRSPGHLRWTHPLPGPYRLDGKSGAWLQPVALGTDGDGFDVTNDGNHVMLLASNTLTALDASTGERLWRRTLSGDLRMPTWWGDRLVVESIAPGGERTWLSVDPSRRDTPVARIHAPGRPLEEDYGSDVTRHPATEPLVYLTSIFDDGPALVTRVDPATGSTIWQRKLADFRGSTVRRGILYLDDTRWRTDEVARTAGRRLRRQAEQMAAPLPPDDGATQARAVQRVDLRTGKRLSDVPLPRSAWGFLSLSRVTDDGVAVFDDLDTDEDVAVDLHRGARVAVPADDEDDAVSGSPEGPDASITGSSKRGTERVVAKDRHGHTRWSGPGRVGIRTVLLLDTAPRIVVAPSCLPGGFRRTELTDPFDGVICTAPVLEAYTW